MHKVPTLAIDALAVCPICGDPDSARVTHVWNGVIIGDYRCPAGHIWETKWMVPA